MLGSQLIETSMDCGVFPVLLKKYVLQLNFSNYCTHQLIMAKWWINMANWLSQIFLSIVSTSCFWRYVCDNSPWWKPTTRPILQNQESWRCCTFGAKSFPSRALAAILLSQDSFVANHCDIKTSSEVLIHRGSCTGGPFGGNANQQWNRSPLSTPFAACHLCL